MLKKFTLRLKYIYIDAEGQGKGVECERTIQATNDFLATIEIQDQIRKECAQNGIYKMAFINTETISML